MTNPQRLAADCTAHLTTFAHNLSFECLYICSSIRLKSHTIPSLSVSSFIDNAAAQPGRWIHSTVNSFFYRIQHSKCLIHYTQMEVATLMKWFKCTSDQHSSSLQWFQQHLTINTSTTPQPLHPVSSPELHLVPYTALEYSGRASAYWWDVPLWKVEVLFLVFHAYVHVWLVHHPVMNCATLFSCVYT